MNATWIDWLIVAAVLLGIGVAGYLCRRFVAGVSDFVVAGRSVRKYLALSTGLAESICIITFARIIQQGFVHGASYVWIDIIDLTVIVGLFGYLGLVVVRFRRGGFMTVAQYFEARFSKGTRLLAGFITAIAGVLNFAVFPIVASHFLTYFLNAPLHVEILGIKLATIPTLMAVLILLALFFTNMGGMVAVMLIGYIQAIILSIGMAIMVIMSISHVGVGPIVTSLRTGMGSAAFNPFIGGSYGPVFLLWIGINTFFVYIAFSPTMQKIASADNEKTAQVMTFIGVIFGKGRIMIMMLIGIAAYAAFGNNVPEMFKGLSKEEWSRIAGPLFLGKVLPPVAFGIVLTSLLSAFVTTSGTYLLSWSSIIVNDVLCVMKKEPLSAKGHLLSYRIIIISIALFLFGFGFVYKPTESILEYIYLTGTMFTGIGISLVFGLYWKRTTAAGACAAILCAGLLPFVDLLLRRLPWLHYDWPTQYAGLGAILIAMFACFVVSLVTKKHDTTQVDSIVEARQPAETKI